MNASEICIIGAGLSGLTCAYRLQQKGHRVSVYEALDRPGGRVLTYYSGDSYEELGGKFLSDGGEAIHICNLIHELGLEIDSREVPYTRNYIHEGKSLPFNSLIEILPEPNEKTYQRLQMIASFSQHFGEVLDHFFHGISRVRQLMEQRMRGYEGSASSSLSPKYLELFWVFYVQTYEFLTLEKQGIQPTFTVPTVRGGNSRLAQALCTAIGNSVHYQMPLKEIHEQSNGQLLLKFENGKERLTDYLILTVPLPILKEISFDESLLPAEQKKAFHHLPFGMNSKILIPITPPTVPVDPQFGFTNHGVTWLNYNQDLMTVYFGGEYAQFSSDASSIQEIYRRELPILKQLYPHIYFPSEEKVIGMGWPQESYFKGSYSNYGLEMFEPLHEIIMIHDVPVKKMFAPLRKMVFFAGEGTAIDYPSTMEGAVESAEHISTLVHKITIIESPQIERKFIQ
jgi:monoamine oxidase